LKSPKAVRELVQRRYISKHRQWLLGAPGNNGWPLSFGLDMPSENEAMGNTAAVRSWIQKWQDWPGPGTVKWEERRWNAMGTQRLPARLDIVSPRDVAALIGRSELARWDRVVGRRELLAGRWPTLASDLGRHFNVLADFEDIDFDRLIRMVQWLVDHPASNLYARQIPVEGLDTKWVESRRQVVQQWVATILGMETAGKDFYDICGLKRMPDTAKVLVLDPLLRERVGRLRDITAPISELAAADLFPSVVLIVENKTTGQALPDISGAVAIIGRGYAVEFLAELPWIVGARCFYWGDIDTHGFAILHRARHYVPDLESVMMDRETLQRHEFLCVREENKSVVEILNKLTEAEQGLYATLRERGADVPARLEQERLNWAYVLERLAITFNLVWTTTELIK
jgi:hypothetical protein